MATDKTDTPSLKSEERPWMLAAKMRRAEIEELCLEHEALGIREGRACVALETKWLGTPHNLAKDDSIPLSLLSTIAAKLRPMYGREDAWTEWPDIPASVESVEDLAAYEALALIRACQRVSYHAEKDRIVAEMAEAVVLWDEGIRRITGDSNQTRAYASYVDFLTVDYGWSDHMERFDRLEQDAPSEGAPNVIYTRTRVEEWVQRHVELMKRSHFCEHEVVECRSRYEKYAAAGLLEKSALRVKRDRKDQSSDENGKPVTKAPKRITKKTKAITKRTRSVT